MKINQTPKNNLSFSHNKFFLNGLEKISDHGASFACGASLLGAVALRPLAISLTPKTDNENKKYASANSLASGIMKFLIAEMAALPVENAIKKIDENPKKFLNERTLKNFYNDKKSYKFLSQTIKQATNFFTAIPKSCLTVAFIPFIADNFFIKKPKKENINPEIFNPSKDFSAFKNISFKGGINKTVTGGVSKLINSENLQNFSIKHNSNAQNITRNTSILTDILLTLTSVVQTKKSKKIEEKRKNPLIYNNILSTTASVVFGCTLDKLVQNTTKKSVENFKNHNKTNPKLDKYIEGINILRPTIIFALVYYGLLPVATTYLADKLDKNINSKKPEN